MGEKDRFIRYRVKYDTDLKCVWFLTPATALRQVRACACDGFYLKQSIFRQLGTNRIRCNMHSTRGTCKYVSNICRSKVPKVPRARYVTYMYVVKRVLGSADLRKLGLLPG